MQYPTAKIIKEILFHRYHKTHIFFNEFRPLTGYEATNSAIDALAFGTYKNECIISFEIKTSRNDFLADRKNFYQKHNYALKISHEFYYVCQWGLIEKEEVPSEIGIIYINKSNKAVTYKYAVRKLLDNVPFRFFQGFIYRMNELKGVNVLSGNSFIKYMGKELSYRDLHEIVFKEKQKQIKEEANRLYSILKSEEKTKRSRMTQILRRIEKAAGLEYSQFLDNGEKENKELVRILNYIDIGKMFCDNPKKIDKIKKELIESLNSFKRAVEDL
jgi:hypothetical protein